MDMPKSLGNAQEIEKRYSLLDEPHVIKLNNFVKNIRNKENLEKEIPFFDPFDGGENAQCLFLLEAPGPNAVKSGFISRDNPDETAKNMYEILQDLEIDRKKTVLWNIVPWYIGTGSKIRPANSNDISVGWNYLTEILGLLPKLKVIVLVGLKPQKIENKLINECKKIKIVKCNHPSPLFINNKKENRSKLIEQLKEVKKYLED